MVNRKNRCDFFYFTAKKYKFRSRAAFKLIELNKKFSFLHKAHCILDLCAAPGSWMQVCRRLAPCSASIIGLDIYPIRKIKGCQTMKGDITSYTCVNSISNIIKMEKKKINVVLHDGSPKMGTEWLLDVYKQNSLVLSAFRLIRKLLCNNGWFVTKIFKSEYFNNLYFTLKYFFKKIFIFKPIACRDNSTETYLVCKQYYSFTKKYNFLIQPSFIFREFVSPIETIKKSKHWNFVPRKRLLQLSELIKDKNLVSMMKMNTIENNDEDQSVFGTSFFNAKIDEKKNQNSKIEILIITILSWAEKNFYLNKKFQ
nr:SAM-dependent methyltransferase [Cryptomonas sp.]